MSAVIDKGRWTRDCTCLECGSVFVYEADDIELDSRFLEYIAECPHCGARCEVAEVSVKRMRELMQKYVESLPPVAFVPSDSLGFERVREMKATAKKGSRK